MPNRIRRIEIDDIERIFRLHRIVACRNESQAIVIVLNAKTKFREIKFGIFVIDSAEKSLAN
jgi:hypothetical protein